MSGKHLVFVTWKTGNAPAFETAKRLGHEVTLIRSRAMERTQNIDFDATPHGRYVDTVHVLDNATDLAALRDCVGEIHRHRPIDGFLATVDALVVPVAVLAEELGIPFTTSHGAATAKQKNRCRERLAAAGVDRTRHQLVRTVAQAREFARTIGYPVMVKPPAASASEGALVLADSDALERFFAGAAADRLYGAGVLVEEYLSGEFFSAEIGISHGRILRLAISDRKRWARHEALELGVTIPAVLGPAETEAVFGFAERVIEAVDLRLGVFHVEIMLTADGPRLIELNPRVMGSCLPGLFAMAGGGDLFELLIRVYLNEPVGAEPVRFDRFATVRWFGAAEPVPNPVDLPELSWAADYGEPVRSLTVRFPCAETLPPCRGNLGNFGEVQVVHEDYRNSVRIAEEIVEKVEAQLGFGLTR